ncbi:MAG: Stp1/IreP family PP2C-type Ser/Thr phosphatase [Bdellovibrionota bacterium]|nr:MAG: Stp1/IreP family PP2C-type Ser/Thr phosphatase [Bdellovibrionota bacterium]
MTSESEVPHTSPIKALRVAHATDIGLRREENQDSFGVIETDNFHYYVVADGMGGVKGGAIASGLAIKVLEEGLKEKAAVTPEDLVALIQKANSEIFQRGTNEPTLQGMGTTLVGLCFYGTTMAITNVGDSRAFRIRNGVIEQLTQDHTLVMELVRSGAISPEQAGNHPVSHMLTRSLGPSPSVDVDCTISPDGPAQGDVYILCSDGLYNMVGPEEFTEIIQSCDLEDAVVELVDLANLRGGTDNITVIAVEVGFEYPVTLEELGISPEPEMPEGQPSASQQRQENGHDTIAADSAAHASNGTAPHANKVEEAAAPGNQTKQEAAKEKSAQKAPQEEEAAAPDAAALPEADAASKRRRQYALYLTVALLAFSIGILSSQFGLFGREEGEQVVVASRPRSATVAELETQEGPESPSNAVRTKIPNIFELPSETKVEPVAPSDRGSTGVLVPPSLRTEEVQRILRRKQELRQLLRDLSDKIESFDRPFSGRAGQILAEASQRADELKNELVRVRAEIDIATRKLAVWYGRRRRFLTSDPINLASEVAVTSPVVKDRKEAFERATWAYLKEAEVARYQPDDAAQNKKVAELLAQRKARMNELEEEVRRAIDKEVSDADHHISELTLRRDAIDSELEQLRREVEYVRVLTGNDPVAKEIKRKELLRERSLIVGELEELDQILPDSDQTASVTARSE